jgi:hypothetical protein
MLLTFGCLLIVVAAGWLGYKMYLSYHSAGGTNLMDPIYDAAVYPPIITAIGLFCVLHSLSIKWYVWVYVLIWLGLTGLFAAVLRLSQELGDKPL